MAKGTAVVLLALGAALFIAISDVIHQRSAHRVADESIGHLALFARLLVDRRSWLGSLVAGTVFQQSSFRAGALTASLPTMTVLEPTVAAALGVALLGEVVRPGRSGGFVLAAARVVLIIAVAVLPRGEAAVDDDSPAGGDCERGGVPGRHAAAG